MPRLTIRLLSANGKGFSNAAFTMLNSPVAAAIPTARETTAVAAKPGLRRKIRSAYRRSTARLSSKEVSSATSAKAYYPAIGLGARSTLACSVRRPERPRHAPAPHGPGRRAEGTGGTVQRELRQACIEIVLSAFRVDIECVSVLRSPYAYHRRCRDKTAVGDVAFLV